MSLIRRSFITASAALPFAGAALAEALPPTPVAGDAAAPVWPSPERIVLWPEGPPGAPAQLPVYSATMHGPQGARQIWVTGVASPDISIFRPKHPTGEALLVIPGGGYEFLAVQNEGTEVAKRFNAYGITVCVLSYRLPGEGWANRQRVPLQDAQRAMRLLRASAGELGIDAARIGILGFSAGGHLAADFATAFDEPCYTALGEVDKASARPAFAGLIYPVASFRKGVHAGSRDNLLGPNASPELVKKHSPADHVRPDTPPCFIAHAMDDKTVPIEASLAMISGCRKAGVLVEAHLFAEGGHGFGLRSTLDLPAAQWPDLFLTWMRSQKDRV